MSRKEKLLHGQQEKVAEMQRKKIIEVKNVSMRFRLTDDKIMSLKEFVTRKLSGKYKTSEFWALKNVSFDVYRGEVVGIIGHNGAGKSTILKVISGILKPTEGSVTCGGNIVPMLELGSGFDHDLTGRENIFLNGAILGYTEEFLQSKYDEIVAFSELGEFIDVPIRNYSSGMLMRLAFSIATVVNPQILIVGCPVRAQAKETSGRVRAPAGRMACRTDFGACGSASARCRAPDFYEVGRTGFFRLLRKVQFNNL